MMTCCELCTREIDEDDVYQCSECDLDGLCDECAVTHPCPAQGTHT